MGTKLYVGNLPYSTTEETLRELFGAEGRQVKEVTLVSDRFTGQARGFGFVEMGTPQDAEAAIASLNGTNIGGRSIQVSCGDTRADHIPYGRQGQRIYATRLSQQLQLLRALDDNVPIPAHALSHLWERRQQRTAYLFDGLGPIHFNQSTGLPVVLD